jgi:hypothetical protein
VAIGKLTFRLLALVAYRRKGRKNRLAQVDISGFQ